MQRPNSNIPRPPQRPRSKIFRQYNDHGPKKPKPAIRPNRPIIRAQRPSAMITVGGSFANSTGNVAKKCAVYKGNLEHRRAYVGEFVGTIAPTFKGAKMNSVRPKDLQTRLEEVAKQEFRNEKQKREKLKRTKFAQDREAQYTFEFTETQGRKRSYLGRQKGDSNYEYAILEFKPGANPVVYPARYIQFRVKDGVIGKDVVSAEEADKRMKREWREQEKTLENKFKKMTAYQKLRTMFETPDQKEEYKTQAEMFAQSISEGGNEMHGDSKRLRRNRLRGECDEIVDYRFSASDDEDEAPPDDFDRIHDSESDHIDDSDESEEGEAFQKLDQLQKEDVDKKEYDLKKLLGKENNDSDSDGWGGAGDISDVSDDEASARVGSKRSLSGQQTGSNKKRRVENPNVRNTTGEDRIEEDFVKSVLMTNPNGIPTSALLSTVKSAYTNMSGDKFKKQLQEILRKIGTLRAVEGAKQKCFFLKDSLKK